MGIRMAAGLLFLVFLVCSLIVSTQGSSQGSTSEQRATATAATDVQQNNLDEYTELLRTDVHDEKAQVMGAVMRLDEEQAKKFWPIYSEYNVELTKLDKGAIANIQEYARNYDQMTEEKADAIIQNSVSYRRQRSDLLARYYERVKASLGAVQAARFFQIESQLLTIIDLQIQSSLPVVAQF